MKQCPKNDCRVCIIFWDIISLFMPFFPCLIVFFGFAFHQVSASNITKFVTFVNYEFYGVFFFHFKRESYRNIKMLTKYHSIIIWHAFVFHSIREKKNEWGVRSTIR